MSNIAALHPNDAQLLRFCDGELAAAEAAKVEQHLVACWHCRTQLEDIQAVISDYVHYRNETLHQEMPPPPQQWSELRLEAEAPRRSIFPRFLYAAAAAAVVCFIVYRLNYTPAVRAAELLQKAAAAEKGSANRAQRVRIRRGGRTFTRGANESIPELQAIFIAANFNWENPLSAESYLAWSKQLPKKVEQVETSAGAYRVRTTTPSGSLAEATIELRKNDLRAVREVLQFRDDEAVEISEVEETAGRIEAPATPPRGPEVLAKKAEERTSASDELHAIAALHAIGADLGEPVEVTRRDGRVVVTATGVTDFRKQQLLTALARVPNVDIQFPAQERTVSRASGSGQRVSSADTRFETQLREKLGGAEAFSAFADDVLARSDRMMERAHALRSLSEKFPVAVESELNDPDRRLLATIRAEHAEALSSELARIGQTMASVLPQVSAPAENAAMNSWQAASQQLLAAAQNADRLLGSLLAGSSGDAAATPTDAAMALARLGVEINRYRRITPAK